MVPNPAAAKRALVLHSARNSETGLKLFAGQLRREYGVKPSEKMSDHDVLQAAYDLSAKDEPNLSPDTFMRDLHSAYGDTVDKALLRQAHEDFPGTDSETDLIDKLYKAKIRNEELPPITYEDKAQILARRYPDLHKSALEPDTALKQVYTLSKAEGKVEGSYNDWLHEQAAPTLYEKVLALGGGLARGLKGQAVDVARFANTLSNAYSNPASLASDVALATQAGDSKAGQDAKARLISAGKGASVGSKQPRALSGSRRRRRYSRTLPKARPSVGHRVAVKRPSRASPSARLQPRLLVVQALAPVSARLPVYCTVICFAVPRWKVPKPQPRAQPLRRR
jgi:hypothetical protein